MMWLLFIGFLIYAVWLSIIARRFANSIPKRVADLPPEIRFSIIVPYRNEEKHLPPLLKSVKKINYPGELLEIIFVDDHSDDMGSEWLKSAVSEIPFSVRILNNPENKEGKKHALTTGIHAANGTYILTTDADCQLPPHILLAYNTQILNQHSSMIAGPVSCQSAGGNSIPDMYQVIENAGLVVIGARAISGSKPVMSNGANLCFQKSVFMQVNGYYGNFHIPGGDDEFLMDKFYRNKPDSISFIYDRRALVTTTVQPTWKDMLNQRVRWASKAKRKGNKSVFITQVLVFCVFTALLAQWLLLPFNGQFRTLIQITGIKLLTDLYFYTSIRSFFGMNFHPLRVVPASLLQLFIIPWVALNSLRGDFTWKKRDYKI